MVFIRLWVCIMTCTWCDTRYSLAPEFKDITIRQDYSPKELATFLLQSFPEITWFNFTGGEPSLWDEEINETTRILQSESKKVCIQTNGKQWKDPLFTNLDKVCMDIKCPQSGETSDVLSISKLREQDEMKLVLETPEDINYAKDIITNYPTKASIIIQPVMVQQESLDQYYDRIRVLIQEFDYLSTNNLRILPQLHQLLWRDQAGK